MRYAIRQWRYSRWTGPVAAALAATSGYGLQHQLVFVFDPAEDEITMFSVQLPSRLYCKVSGKLYERVIFAPSVRSLWSSAEKIKDKEHMCVPSEGWLVRSRPRCLPASAGLPWVSHYLSRDDDFKLGPFSNLQPGERKKIPPRLWMGGEKCDAFQKCSSVWYWTQWPLWPC